MAAAIARASVRRAASVRIPRFWKAHTLARVREYAGHDGLNGVSHGGVETEPSRQRQVLMVLQAAAEVRQLDRRNRTRHTAVFLRMEPFFSRVDEHAVAMDISAIVCRPVRLAAVIERDAVRPDVLVTLALFCELWRQWTAYQ